MVPKKFGKDDIFKYGSLNDLERTLNDETLGFSKLSDYNDPFESEYSTYLFIENSVKRANFMRTDFTQKCEAEIWGSHENIKDWIADYLNNQKVTCFSQSPIEPLMWSHYAEKHNGVCYWFDKEVYGREYNSSEVVYSSQLPKLQLVYGSTTSVDIARQLESILLTKSQHWSYEKEFRFYIASEDKIHKFNPKSLKSIILGMRSAEEFYRASQLVTDFNRRNETNVRVLYANMSSDRYEMEINSMTTSRWAIHCPDLKETINKSFW